MSAGDAVSPHNISREKDMAKFLFLLHEDPARYVGLSAAEMGQIIERYAAWAQGLAARGQLAGGEKLADDGGRHLRRTAAGVLAVDGPYTESKDVIGGFFMVEAQSLAAAEQLAHDCPHLTGDNWIEVRAIESVG
jgi:hypothetical protein